MTTRRALLGGALAAAAAAAASALTPPATALPPAPARTPAAERHVIGRTAAAERHVIGRSHRDRPIVAFRIGAPDASSRYLVLGSMHGDEPAGDRIAVNRLLDRAAPDGVQLWVVPTMNPDGLAAGTRTNARGVDLNRNFPSADWRHQDAGTRYWSGPSAASERETRAMVRFLSDLAPHTVVSIHQPLSCVDYSGGDRSVTRWLADRLGLPARKLGASGGNLTTWFNDRFPKRTAVTLELGRTVSPERAQRVARTLVRHAAHLS